MEIELPGIPNAEAGDVKDSNISKFSDVSEECEFPRSRMSLAISGIIRISLLEISENKNFDM